MGYDKVVVAIIQAREVIEKDIRVSTMFKVPTNTGRDGRGRHVII